MTFLHHVTSSVTVTRFKQEQNGFFFILYRLQIRCTETHQFDWNYDQHIFKAFLINNLNVYEVLLHDSKLLKYTSYLLIFLTI